MNNLSIAKLLQSNQKLELIVTENRDPVDESGYIRYTEPVMKMDDATTRALLKLALRNLENSSEEN